MEFKFFTNMYGRELAERLGLDDKELAEKSFTDPIKFVMWFRENIGEFTLERNLSFIMVTHDDDHVGNLKLVYRPTGGATKVLFDRLTKASRQ